MVRALSKVFFSHADESAALQAELNAARERFTSRNLSLRRITQDGPT